MWMLNVDPIAARNFRQVARKSGFGPACPGLD
jgi:hypothetical protein